ncbi:MAG: type I-E CRISPR-associated protein Cse2/CasB [Trueperaceae bacterium]
MSALRRGLRFPIGTYYQASAVVEPFLTHRSTEWRRSVFYFTAYLYATHQLNSGASTNLGHTVRAALQQKPSQSMRRKFLAVLQSQGDEIWHPLTWLIRSLQDHPINWNSLHDDLLVWHKPRVREGWMRAFYNSEEEK